MLIHISQVDHRSYFAIVITFGLIRVVLYEHYLGPCFQLQVLLGGISETWEIILHLGGVGKKISR